MSLKLISLNRPCLILLALLNFIILDRQFLYSHGVNNDHKGVKYNNFIVYNVSEHYSSPILLTFLYY